MRKWAKGTAWALLRMGISGHDGRFFRFRLPTIASMRPFRSSSSRASSSFTYIRVSRETCSFLLLPVWSFLPSSPIFSMSLCSTCMWISSRSSRREAAALYLGSYLGQGRNDLGRLVSAQDADSSEHLRVGDAPLDVVGEEAPVDVDGRAEALHERRPSAPLNLPSHGFMRAPRIWRCRRGPSSPLPLWRPRNRRTSPWKAPSFPWPNSLFTSCEQLAQAPEIRACAFRVLAERAARSSGPRA